MKRELVSLRSLNAAKSQIFAEKGQEYALHVVWKGTEEVGDL